jgi:ParB family chromosome partitioning protein
MTLIPVDKILPNPDQPRKVFKDQELQELANSMKEVGLVLPIAVEEADGAYILQDGERRLRAAKLLKWMEIEVSISHPVTVSSDRLVRGLVANIQRKDLTPTEEGRAYLKLKETGMSVARIAHLLGTYRMRVQQRLDLLQLDEEIQELVDLDLLPIDRRVIDAFGSVANPEARVKLARRLARPGVKIRTIQAACTKLNEAMRSTSLAGRNPIMELARRKTRLDPLPKWDILAQAKVVPPWKIVLDGAVKACEGCSLRDIASETTCQECPAVEFLKAMMEFSHGH